VVDRGLRRGRRCVTQQAPTRCAQQAPTSCARGPDTPPTHTCLSLPCSAATWSPLSAGRRCRRSEWYSTAAQVRKYTMILARPPCAARKATWSCGWCGGGGSKWGTCVLSVDGGSVQGPDRVGAKRDCQTHTQVHSPAEAASPQRGRSCIAASGCWESPAPTHCHHHHHLLLLLLALKRRLPASAACWACCCRHKLLLLLLLLL
jgi:hypothetical protein